MSSTRSGKVVLPASDKNIRSSRQPISRRYIQGLTRNVASFIGSEEQGHRRDVFFFDHSFERRWFDVLTLDIFKRKVHLFGAISYHPLDSRPSHRTRGYRVRRDAIASSLFRERLSEPDHSPL